MSEEKLMMVKERSILDKLIEKVYEKEGEYPEVRHFGVILLHPETWHNLIGQLYAKNHYVDASNFKFRGYKIFRTVDVKPDEIAIYYE
jgi:hypothetical protein